MEPFFDLPPRGIQPKMTQPNTFTDNSVRVWLPADSGDPLVAEVIAATIEPILWHDLQTPVAEVEIENSSGHPIPLVARRFRGSVVRQDEDFWHLQKLRRWRYRMGASINRRHDLISDAFSACE